MGSQNFFLEVEIWKIPKQRWVKSMEASQQCPHNITSLTCTLMYAFEIILDRRQAYQPSHICPEIHGFLETSIIMPTFWKLCKFHSFPNYCYTNCSFCSEWRVIIWGWKNTLVTKNTGDKVNSSPRQLQFF